MRYVSTLALLAVLLPSSAIAQDAGDDVTGLAQAAQEGTARAEQANQAAQQSAVEEPGDENIPIVGASRLLQSLDELDRPLSPEEITAYGAAIQSQMPMPPELIRDYKRRVNESQRAAAMPPSGFRPNSVSDQIRVSLEAKGKAPKVATSPGTVSVLAFYDRTGEAWPVASYVVGRPDAFQVYALQEGSNQVAITPLVTHGYSNLIISLVGEDRPLVVDMETNEQMTHFRRDLVVNGLGPNAVVSTGPAEPPMRASDDVMMAFVQGADLPGNAVRLSTDNSAVSAWLYNGELYIRTENTLISPSWSASLTGPGSIHAYRLKPTPVALITRNGSVEKVRIYR
jgi:intracellular multiplication protein IcmK